jgi:hypothetical protein
MERNIVLRAVAVIALGIAFVAAASAQDQQVPAATGPKPNDVVVAVDVSGSMSEKGVFKDVKAYLERDLVRPLLKVGDRFTLIVFGSSARAFPTRTIASEADIDAVVASIGELEANQDFTDLGSALETLDGAMASHAEGDFRPVAVFITDGKNAPPPASPFSGKDLSVDDRFTESGRRIAKKGWFLYVVGLGAKNDAEVVAAAVEGSTAVGASSSVEDSGGSSTGIGNGARSGGSAAAQALSAAPLVAYLEETAEATEERAVAAETAKADALKASRGSLPVLLAAAGGAVILAAFIFLIVAVKRRAEKKDDKKVAPKA